MVQQFHEDRISDVRSKQGRKKYRGKYQENIDDYCLDVLGISTGAHIEIY